MRAKALERLSDRREVAEIADRAAKTQDGIVLSFETERGHIGNREPTSGVLGARDSNKVGTQVRSIDIIPKLLDEQPCVFARATRNVEDGVARWMHSPK